MVRVLVGAAVFCLGGYWAAHRKQRIWSDYSWALFVVAALAALGCLTGLWRLWAGGDSSIAAVHRWSGHALVIAFWCLLAAAVGAGMASLRCRPCAAISAVLLVLACFLLVLVESFTGYLSPQAGERGAVAEETLNRFYVLHCVLLPFLILAMPIIGALILHRLRQDTAALSRATDDISPAPPANP